MITLAIWGEVTPGAILTKCGLLGDIVDVITCAIFRDCRLRGVGVVRALSLPSPIDLTRRPYNTGDRVIHTISTRQIKPYAMLKKFLKSMCLSLFLKAHLT